MLYIKNTTAAVKVIKTWGYPDLRLLPGMNQIPLEMEDIDRMKQAKAVDGLFKSKYLVIADETELTSKQVTEAKEARAKNDKLNKSKKVVGVNSPAQKTHTQQLIEKDKIIKELEKKLAKKTEKKA